MVHSQKSDSRSPKAAAKNGARKEEWYLHSEMLEHRIIRLDGEIDANIAAQVTASITYLEKKDPVAPIYIVINSPGGYVSDGMAIVDKMRTCECPIHTVVYGQASSMASVILAVGNKRYAAPHAEIMIHQPLGGAEGQTTEIDIGARDMRNTREMLTQIYAEETGLSYEDIDSLIERDFNMTAATAQKLGIIDDIMTQELYFKLLGKEVPEFKKPRFPDAKRETPLKSIEDKFNDIANKAALGKKPPVAPSNDNGKKAPASPKKKKDGNTPKS